MSTRRSPLIAALCWPQALRWSQALRWLLALVLLPALSGIAYGEPRWSQSNHPDRDERGQRPVREAIGEVEQNYRGHVVNVQSLRKDETDEDVYRMRVLQRDGRVKTVTVPANQRHR